MVVPRFAPETTGRIGPERRVTIPQHYAEALPWVRGHETLSVWLLLHSTGRFRLLADKQATEDETLRDIRSTVVDGPADPVASPTAFEPNERAALIGRMVVTTLAPPPPTWRLTIPKQIFPDDNPERTLTLLFSLGYLEIWFSETFNAALISPLTAIIGPQ
jgi:hypothetical protein